MLIRLDSKFPLVSAAVFYIRIACTRMVSVSPISMICLLPGGGFGGGLMLKIAARSLRFKHHGDVVLNGQSTNHAIRKTTYANHMLTAQTYTNFRTYTCEKEKSRSTQIESNAMGKKKL